MNTEQIVYQLSLGKLIFRYKRPLLQYPQISFGLALGIPFFLLGLLILAQSFHTDSAKGTSSAALFLLLPSIGVIGFSLAIFIVHRKDAQFLYEKGLVDIFKGTVRGLRYDNITEIHQKHVGTNYQGKNAISQASGLILALSDSSQIMKGGAPIYQYRFHSQNAAMISSTIQEVGEYVKEEVFRYLLPQMARIYNNNEIIQFGFFSLSHQGLNTTKGLLSWSEPWEIEKEVSSSGIFVSVKLNQQKRNWINVNQKLLRISIDKISNFEIFWKLVNHLHETHGKFQIERL
jgi:hypothetical protein